MRQSGLHDCSVTLAEEQLLRLVRLNWDASAWPPPSSDQDVDWTTIVQKALDHGVAGFLCRSLCSLPPGAVPEDIVDAAHAFLENEEAQGVVRVTQMFDVLDVLKASNVPALPFKGPMLGLLAHADTAIRPSRDIDVLVRREDMGPAVAALSQLGYRLEDSFSPRITEACYESYGQDVLLAEGRFTVEPHWAFTSRALSVDLDLDGLWSRATKVSLAGRDVPTLSLEDTLLTACLHGSKEKWWRLLWIADVAAFIHRQPALDWSVLMERADACGMRRMFLLGLALAKNLFLTHLPTTLSLAIERDRKCLQLVQESKSYLFTPGRDVGSVHHLSRYHWNARERVRDRVRYFWRTISTPQFIHYRMIRLPETLVSGYVPVKLIHDYVLLPLWQLGKGPWRRQVQPSTTDVAE